MEIRLRAFLTLFIIFLTFTGFSQVTGKANNLSKSRQDAIPMCVANTPDNVQLLQAENIKPKYFNENWIYFTLIESGAAAISEELFDKVYVELSAPVLLSDSARAKHFVDSVHLGTAGIDRPYTGKGVLVGVVDEGLDFNHPDFQDSLGNTRVLRYWDQSMPSSPNSPQPYGYGFVWDSTMINNGFCTSMDSGGHGTTVAGQAVGNGNANGTNHGMAPDADIIIVETDFGLGNWTLTVADACDYIFKVADSMGRPAVVNLSLGTYLGSHDGNDPAASYMESLVSEKGGRIIVCAAGNSGNQAAYHVGNSVNADTSFFWMTTNPSSFFGPNTVFFDLWADPSEATWDYSISVDRPAPDWSEAGSTSFRNATANLGSIVLDTIRNENNDILCTAQILIEQVYGAYHMQMLLEDCDSTNNPPYLYRFNTTGSGSYDLWSGAWLGLNHILDDFELMSPAQYPNVVYYAGPDSTQSIVSSWNCSEQIVSVGNMKNRWSHIDRNMNTYVSGGVSPGELSLNSSKGPNRHNIIKPDVTAAGDISLTAAPFSFLNNPGNYSAVDSSGWFARNGGTSMASPVVAGIAALYLEKCPFATYSDFLNDLHATAYSDNFTGTTPNNAYGYGKAHALDLILNMVTPTQPTISISGSMQISSSTAQQYQWYLNGEPIENQTGQDLIIYETTGTYQVQVVAEGGCYSTSDPMVVTLGLNEEMTQFDLYPNPTSHSITVKSNEPIEEIRILDKSGKTVLSFNSGASFDISQLKAGSYIILVKTSSEIIRSKLIKL
ncbi:MAG: S8 family peptidase [Crocinitomicaceae bacterium]